MKEMSLTSPGRHAMHTEGIVTKPFFHITFMCMTPFKVTLF